MAFTTRRDVYNDAVTRLKPYLNSTGKEDFVAAILTGQDLVVSNTQQEVSENEKINSLKGVIDPIVDVINGGYYTTELLSKIEESMKGSAAEKAAEVAKYIRFTVSDGMSAAKTYSNCYNNGVIHSVASSNLKEANIDFQLENFVPRPYDGDGPDYYDPAKASKSRTNISVIEILNSNLGTAARDTTGLSIFTSLVPTHVISRAVPYVALRIYGNQAASKGEAGDITAKSLNLFRYLKGEAVWDSKNPSDGILGFRGADNLDFKSNVGGMELFTAPQTMVSEETWNEGFKKSKPIDRFRPLMSLTSISFDVVSAGAGFISFKTAKAELVLHDRGRLAEVAPFVKSGLYGKTEIEIEYGWSIDSSGGRKASNVDVEVAKKRGETINPGDRIYGARLSDDALSQFVDSLRVTEKYIIVNSSFNFDDTGQVNISLDLSMKGAAETKNIDVTASTASTAKEKLKELIEDINGSLASTSQQIKDIIPENLLGAVASEDSAYSLDEKTLKEVQESITKLRNSAGAGKLESIVAQMDKVFVVAAAAQALQTKSVDEIFESLKRSQYTFAGCGADLETNSTTWNFMSVRPNLVKSGHSYLNEDDYKGGGVSLGAALVTLVGHPLMRSGKFNEVQFIFNKFNDRAGYARNMSIAGFQLDFKRLKDSITKLYKENIRVPVSQVISVISGDHVGNIAYPMYGFSKAYDDKGELKQQKAGEPSRIDAALAAAGILDSNFQKPSLSIQLECVPHYERKEETILRVHVTDQACSPYQELSEAITAGRSDVSRFVDLEAIAPYQPLFQTFWYKDIDPSVLKVKRVKVFEKLKDEGVLAPVLSQASPEVRVETWNLDLNKMLKSSDPVKMKKFMQRSLPVIRYGNSGGLVKNISVSSISDPRLNTINQLRADESSGQPEGSAREKGLPLLVNGTEISIELMGCPILNFGQTFYIDFGTGTSIDNIYACTGLSHKLTPGEFSTSAKFTLLVGAYGIYSSATREFKTTTLLAKAQSSGVANDAGVTTSPTTRPATVKIFSDLKMNSTYSGEELLKKIEETKAAHKLASGLRFWFSDNKPASGLSKYFKVSFAVSDSVEVLTPISLPAKSLAYSTSEPQKLSCYEIPIPQTNSMNEFCAGKFHQFPNKGSFTESALVAMQELDAIIQKKNEDAASMRKERQKK